MIMFTESNPMSPLATVMERDIDLLLLEEYLVNPTFRDWIFCRVFECHSAIETGPAAHSLCHPTLGESDLCLIAYAEDGARLAILAENKIDALPQPAQAARYAQRGNIGIQDGDWDEVRTCLVAPQKYLESSSNCGGYDRHLSYEELQAFFHALASGDERGRYRAQFIRAAIDKSRRGYQRQVSEAMTTFARDYYAAFAADNPDLRIQSPTDRAAGSFWIRFMPATLPPRTRLYHQISSGTVKLYLDGDADRFAELQLKISPKLADHMTLEKASKSLAITIETPSADPLKDRFIDVASDMKKAIDAASLLSDIAPTIGNSR